LFEMKSDEKALSDEVGLIRDDKVAKCRTAVGLLSEVSWE